MSLAPRLVSPAGRSPLLRQFLATLDAYPGPISLDKLLALLRRAPLRVEDVAPYCLFHPEHYTRNLIHAAPHFEVLCLCWRRGQFSPFHDHGKSACAIRVLQGAMTNVDAEEVGPGTVRVGRTTHVLPGAVDGRAERDIHQVINQQADGKDLITLHVYSPPLSHMAVFRPEETVAEEDQAPAASDLCEWFEEGMGL
jgi:cysteine dioxygenase